MNFSNFSSTFLIGEIEKSKSTFAQVLVLKSQHTNQVSPIICIHKKLKDRSEFGSPLLVVISAFRQGLETRVLEVSCCNKTQHFIFLIKKIFLLEYICVSMLYQFLLYSKVNQLYIHIYPCFFRFYSHRGHYKVLNRVPCTIRQFLWV